MINEILSPTVTAMLGVWKGGMEEGSQKGGRGDVLDTLFFLPKEAKK